MGLLPCLRRGSDRWWLPCSPTTTEVLGQVLIAKGRNTQIDLATRKRVVACLGSDPPLMIYAALNCASDRVSLEELADWLFEHIAGRFASGDAFLGAPHVNASMQSRWNRLRDHFRLLPHSQWLQDAALWLEVTGPTVSTTWRQQWPEVWQSDLETDDLVEPAPVQLLQQLARAMQHTRSLDDCLDRRVEKTKLGALKQLAYGLSHEINNPLANISTRAQQLQRGEQDAGRQATLQRIIDQVYRAHEMIADLMFFANPPAAEFKAEDLRGALQSVADSIHDEVQRQAIRLEVRVPEEPTQLSFDKNMMGEAIRALVRNAIEAIGCQGTIVLSIQGEPNRWLIHVADSGPGLSDLARQHAFDPYFSGREAGRGLGLGLCRAYRIAKLHGGDITLAGGPTGCVATISLPAERPGRFDSDD